MPRIRTGRRTYYNLFSHFYDALINLHARRDAGDTRDFLVKTARLEEKSDLRILDICCGTGAVIGAFSRRYPSPYPQRKEPAFRVSAVGITCRLVHLNNNRSHTKPRRNDYLLS